MECDSEPMACPNVDNSHPYMVDGQWNMRRLNQGLRWTMRERAKMSELKLAYTVRLNGQGKGSIEYIDDKCEICGQHHGEEMDK